MSFSKTFAAALVCIPALAYSNKATVSFGAATGGPQTNFTVPFTGTDAKLCSVANSGVLASTSVQFAATVPNDFVFTDDTSGTTITGGYSWDIEYWDQMGCTVKGHLLIATLSNLAAKVPTIAIGQAGDSWHGGTSAYVTAVTKAAYYLPNGSVLNASDFSGNGFDLTNTSVTATTGQIDGAGAFLSGSSSKLVNSLGPVLPAASDITVSFWLFAANQNDSVFTLGNQNPPNSVQSHAPFSNVIYWDYGQNFAPSRVSTSYTAYESLWTKVDLVASGAGNFQAIYLNGVSAVSSVTNTPPVATNTGITLGGWPGAGLFLTGSMDEFKVAFTQRSANWIATAYAAEHSVAVIGAFTPVASGGFKSLMGVGK